MPPLSAITLFLSHSRWSLKEVPKCASICKQFLPEADFESDLLLQKVIPIRDPTNPVDYTEYNKTSSFLYSGDKLLYVCKTEYWGVHGGTDEFHDEFGCTDEGFLNTPQGSDFEDPWPHCAPQQQSKSFKYRSIKAGSL